MRLSELTMKTQTPFGASVKNMSQLLLKITLHDAVDEFMDFCGETDHAVLHEEIDHPEKRSWLFEQFMEWVEN